jgi:glycosyltransferase involved in cell wall biosynthesis
LRPAAAPNGKTTTRVALFLPSLAGGGAERVMVNIAAGFAERGLQTDLVLASATGPHLTAVPPTVRVIDLKSDRVLRSFGPLSTYLRRERPTALLAALHHANLVAMSAAHLPGTRTRTVISIHCHLSKELEVDRGVRNRAIHRLLRHVDRWADGIVAVSDGVADDFARTTGIARSRIDVIYNPVITPGLLTAALAAPPHLWFEDAGRPIILGVGRLTRQKNFPALVDAFALVKRDHEAARLVILGEGPERAAIEARVHHHALQESIALPGYVDNPYACMARAAVLALSSDWEGLPTVLIESLAVGTPVVATDCPSGPREILQNGVLGSLVPPGDVRALASALSRALGAGRAILPADALHAFLPDVVLDQYQRVCRLAS